MQESYCATLSLLISLSSYLLSLEVVVTERITDMAANMNEDILARLQVEKNG